MASEAAGAGLLTSASPHSSSVVVTMSPVAAQKADGGAAEPHAWPHEIFDLLALASAFFAAVAVQPLLAFRADDYATADANSFATTPSSGPHSISSNVALWSSLCSVLTTLSLIAAVIGRAIATTEERFTGARRALLHRLATPFIVVASVPLAFAVIVRPLSSLALALCLLADLT
jgi:hypothetical protein